MPFDKCVETDLRANMSNKQYFDLVHFLCKEKNPLNFTFTCEKFEYFKCQFKI